MDQDERMLQLCLGSIASSFGPVDARILLVNNGSQDLEVSNPKITVLSPGRNLGWEGGLKLGLEHSTARLVMFANDDIFIPYSSRWWLHDLVQGIRSDPKIGAIGPASNVVMGPQIIFFDTREGQIDVNFLIGFCVLLRRSALDEVGGVDDSLPGGDDLDISIRLRNGGWRLVCRKDVFVWHHGFQTGIRLRGGPEKPGGWNSKEMNARTKDAIIAKHGVAAWDSLFGPLPSRKDEHTPESASPESARS